MAKKGALLLRRCVECTTYRGPHEAVCSACYSTSWEPAAAHSEATLISWTVRGPSSLTGPGPQCFLRLRRWWSAAKDLGCSSDCSAATEATCAREWLSRSSPCQPMRTASQSWPPACPSERCDGRAASVTPQLKIVSPVSVNLAGYWLARTALWRDFQVCRQFLVWRAQRMRVRWILRGLFQAGSRQVLNTT